MPNKERGFEVQGKIEIDLGFRKYWNCNPAMINSRLFRRKSEAYLHVVGNTGIDHKMVCHMPYMLLYIVTRILRQRCLQCAASLRMAMVE